METKPAITPGLPGRRRAYSDDQMEALILVWNHKDTNRTHYATEVLKRSPQAVRVMIRRYLKEHPEFVKRLTEELKQGTLPVFDDQLKRKGA